MQKNRGIRIEQVHNIRDLTLNANFRAISRVINLAA